MLPKGIESLEICISVGSLGSIGTGFSLGKWARKSDYFKEIKERIEGELLDKQQTYSSKIELSEFMWLLLCLIVNELQGQNA